MKYIDSEKLIAEIERRRLSNRYIDTEGYENELLEIITSLQQEQPKDKQIIIITESHGDANIEWDCRSLDDVIALLESAESFISDKQIEELRGPGSGPDYNTEEGRYSHLFKRQQEQQPSLLFNLDNAAEEYAENILANGEDMFDAIADGFKAGAEWMAGQFQKIEGELVDWYSSPEGKDYCYGVKTIDSFEVPEGFYIRKK